MDKTYAETVGEKPFDWNKALEDAIANPENYIFCHKLKSKANKWTTCACGNMCNIIPRREAPGEYYHGKPEDEELAELGMRFCGEVTKRNWVVAKVILAKIEARSEILIQIELDKLNANRIPS